MPTQFATGFGSGEEAASTAAESALADLDGDADFVVVFCSSAYEYDDVVASIRAQTGEAPLIGASTSGEFTDEQAGDGGIAVTAIASDEMAFYTGIGHGLSEDLHGAVEEAAAQIPDKQADYPHRVGINLHDGLTGRGEEIAMLAYQQFPIPFSGGSAGDDIALEETFVFHNDEVATDSIVLAVLASEKPFALGVDHGHEPVSEPLAVTDADGSVVNELDDKPAFEAFADAIADVAQQRYGIDPHTVEAGGEDFVELLTRFQFGIKSGGDNYKVRWAGPTPDTGGPMAFATTIPEGTELTVMDSSRQNQIEAARNSAVNARDAMANEEMAGALVFDCACQGAILGEQFGQSVDEMVAELGVPLAGFQTYGEICMQQGEMRGYHNTTSSVLVFPE